MDKRFCDIDWQHDGEAVAIRTRAGVPTVTLSPISAGDPIAVRRRALFDRIIAMDEPALAAMERCAGMIEGTH